jgi:DNA-binding response OmpR family regulator
MSVLMPRVLIAEDNDDLRTLCRIHLENAGMEVVEAANGYEALDAGRREDVDIAVLDVMMPGLDGLRVAEILLGERPDLRVAFLSARTSFEDQLEGLERGAVDYITKPFDPAALAERVEDLLAEDRVTDVTTIRAERQERLR